MQYPNPNIHNQYIDEPKTEVVNPSKTKANVIGKNEKRIKLFDPFRYGNWIIIELINNNIKINSEIKPNWNINETYILSPKW